MPGPGRGDRRGRRRPRRPGQAHRPRTAGPLRCRPRYRLSAAHTAGDNPDRIRSEASFAALCGVSPLPASSGRTDRHRLNRGGDRHANEALWRIIMVRLGHDDRTKAYRARRSEQNLSKPEIIRCLKRYLVRELLPTIRAELAHDTAPPQAPSTLDPAA
ncbi:transposase [Serinicoccus marinus]|uniref:transposase n=1 Tax=Serinicoccus marinus TaxID=247333 RepID=UPI003B8A67F7